MTGIRKFPKLRYPSHDETDGLLNGDVVVTEKFDGANFRFTWNEEGELFVGTRNHSYHYDGENLPKAFRHAVDYVRQTVDTEAERAPDNLHEITLFGEAMHRHSIDYEGIDWHVPNKGNPHVPHTSETPNVVIFDAWQSANSEWFHWDGVTALCDTLGLTHSRVLERGDPDDCDFEVPETSMFGDHPPEGIVVRRLDGTVRAKKVTDDFKEKNAEVFEDLSKAQSDAAEFVAMYITEARIEKMARKLVDRGEYESLKMDMMADLPREVLTDAVSENAWDLLTNGFECEFDDDFKGEVRSKASKKCARVLKTEVQRL